MLKINPKEINEYFSEAKQGGGNRSSRGGKEYEQN